MPTPYVHQIVFVWPVRFFPMFSLSDSNFTMATNSVPSSSTPMTIPWKSDTDSLWWADCCCLVYVMPTSIWPPVEQILQCCWVAEVELSQGFLLTHMYTIWYKQLGRFLDICLTLSNFYFDFHNVIHWERDKLPEILWTTFSNTFSWMETIVFLMKFHSYLFPWMVRPTISQYWFG